MLGNKQFYRLVRKQVTSVVAGLLDSMDGPELFVVVFLCVFFGSFRREGDPNAPLLSNLVGKEIEEGPARKL